MLNLIAPLAIVLAPAATPQQAWQRYTHATGLSAEFPAEPERFFDKWTDIAQGRVILMDRTMPKEYGNFEAYFFLQAVIADKPYNVDAKLKDEVAQRSGGDAGANSSLISHRMLAPSEMPLPGMRGVETVARIQTFGSDRSQVEYARSMLVGNKWLAVSVRHFEGDKRWQHERFFRSVTWRP